MRQLPVIEAEYKSLKAEINSLYGEMNRLGEEHKQGIIAAILGNGILNRYRWKLHYSVSSYDHLNVSLESKDDDINYDSLLLEHQRINPHTFLFFTPDLVKTPFRLSENDKRWYISPKEDGIQPMINLIKEHDLEVDTDALDAYRKKLQDLLDLVSHD